MLLEGLTLPRIGTERNVERESIGWIVEEIARAMGLVFHPWQSYRADICGELIGAPEGGQRLAASTTLTMAGRQTGKTTAVTADVVTRCLAPDLDEFKEMIGHDIGPQHIAFTAQDRIGALGRWYEHVDMIMSSELRNTVLKLVRKNGEECLYFRNGSKYRVITPSKTGARGLALDMAIIDEALAHPSWLLNVIGPTMAQRDGASNSFGAQLVIVTNAGDEKAELLNQQREIGRRAVAEKEEGRVHLEWSCADDDDFLDPEVWKRTIPTLDQPNGISSDYLARQAELLGTEAFAMEYLCRTVISAKKKVISVEQWETLPFMPADGSEVIYAVEMTPDRLNAVVVAIGRNEEFYGIEIMEEWDGVDWVVPRMVDNLGPVTVVIDKFGPAATLVPALKQAEMEVIELNSKDVTDAAGFFVDMVDEEKIGHLGDIRLEESVRGLVRRQRGDRWSFDRYQGTPGAIIAASLGVWVLHTNDSMVAIY